MVQYKAQMKYFLKQTYFTNINLQEIEGSFLTDSW